MAGKTFCVVCGLTHHPGGCKQNTANKKSRSRNLDALNNLSVSNYRK